MNWLQYETKVFNVGNLRRVNKNSQQLDQSATFFDPDNKDGSKIRDDLALMVLDELIDWLKTGGRVAIHDATNSTVQRRYISIGFFFKNGMLNYPVRKLLIDRLQCEPEIKVLLLESVCTDKAVRKLNFFICLHILTSLFRF